MQREQLITLGYIGGAMLSLVLLVSVFFFSLSDDDFLSNEKSDVDNPSDESNENTDSSTTPLGQEKQIGTKEDIQRQVPQNNTLDSSDLDLQEKKTKSRTQDPVEDKTTNTQEKDDPQPSSDPNLEETVSKDTSKQNFEKDGLNSASFSFQKNDVFSSDEHISVLLERSVQDPFQIVVKEKPILCRGEEECLSYVSGITHGYDKGSFTDSRVTLNLDGIDEGVYTVELYQNDQMITVSDEFVITDRRQFLELSVPFYRETEEGEEEIFTFTDEEMLVRWDSSPDVRKLNIYLEKKDSSKTYTLMENIDNVSSFLWRYVDKEGNPIPQGTYTMIFEDSDTSTILDRVDFAFEKE